MFEVVSRIPFSVGASLSVNSSKISKAQEKYNSSLSFPKIEISFGNPLDAQDIYEYEPLIYREMRNKENRNRDGPIPSQDFTPTDRACLCDWLCRLNFKCQLSTNTLYVTMGIVDRILKTTQISKSELILLGCASTLIASKSEDVVPITTEQILIIAENRIKKADLVKMENMIIQRIDYNLTFPTSYIFLSLFLRANQQTRETILFAKYVLELCLTSIHFFCVKPSAIAATAIAFTRLIGGVLPWTQELQYYTQYTLTDLIPHLKAVHSLMLEVQNGRNESQFITRKYGSDPYLNIAHVPIPQNIPCL